jgi:hypothetical protein
VKERRTQSGDQIVDQESFASPDTLQCFSEYPECPHIEENMPQATVHKHMRDDLPRFEHGRLEIEESQDAIQVQIEELLKKVQPQ